MIATGINRAQPDAMNAVESAVEGAAQLMDMQINLTRGALQMQAVIASFFGMPNCSQLILNGGPHAHRWCESSARQVLDFQRVVLEATYELRGAVRQAMERRTERFTGEFRHATDDMVREVQQGLQRLREDAQRQLDELQRQAEPEAAPGGQRRH